MFSFFQYGYLYYILPLWAAQSKELGSYKWYPSNTMNILTYDNLMKCVHVSIYNCVANFNKLNCVEYLRP